MKKQNNYSYSMVRIVCQGKIKDCDHCKEPEGKETVREGYCKLCGRPLWKQSGDACGFIIGYHDRNYNQQNKVHIKCKFCNTVTTI